MRSTTIHNLNLSKCLWMFFCRLNVRMLLLVRDPRGTIQSRKHRDWCPGQPDCDQPVNLCDDLVSDYKAAVRLLDLYPDRFRLVYN